MAKANAAAIERKQQAKLAGRKEIEDMLLYQAMKDAELQKREVRYAQHNLRQNRGNWGFVANVASPPCGI